MEGPDKGDGLDIAVLAEIENMSKMTYKEVQSQATQLSLPANLKKSEMATLIALHRAGAESELRRALRDVRENRHHMRLSIQPRNYLGTTTTAEADSASAIGAEDEDDDDDTLEMWNDVDDEDYEPRKSKSSKIRAPRGLMDKLGVANKPEGTADGETVGTSRISVQDGKAKKRPGPSPRRKPLVAKTGRISKTGRVIKQRRDYCYVYPEITATPALATTPTLVQTSMANHPSLYRQIAQKTQPPPPGSGMTGPPGQAIGLPQGLCQAQGSSKASTHLMDKNNNDMRPINPNRQVLYPPPHLQSFSVAEKRMNPAPLMGTEIGKHVPPLASMNKTWSQPSGDTAPKLWPGNAGNQVRGQYSCQSLRQPVMMRPPSLMSQPPPAAHQAFGTHNPPSGVQQGLICNFDNQQFSQSRQFTSGLSYFLSSGSQPPSLKVQESINAPVGFDVGLNAVPPVLEHYYGGYHNNNAQPFPQVQVQVSAHAQPQGLFPDISQVRKETPHLMQGRLQQTPADHSEAFPQPHILRGYPSLAINSSGDPRQGVGLPFQNYQERREIAPYGRTDGTGPFFSKAQINPVMQGHHNRLRSSHQEESLINCHSQLVSHSKRGAQFQFAPQQPAVGPVPYLPQNSCNVPIPRPHSTPAVLRPSEKLPACLERVFNHRGDSLHMPTSLLPYWKPAITNSINCYQAPICTPSDVLALDQIGLHSAASDFGSDPGARHLTQIQISLCQEFYVEHQKRMAQLQKEETERHQELMRRHQLQQRRSQQERMQQEVLHRQQQLQQRQSKLLGEHQQESVLRQHLLQQQPQLQRGQHQQHLRNQQQQKQRSDLPYADFRGQNNQLSYPLIYSYLASTEQQLQNIDEAQQQQLLQELLQSTEQPPLPGPEDITDHPVQDTQPLLSSVNLEMGGVVPPAVPKIPNQTLEQLSSSFNLVTEDLPPSISVKHVEQLPSPYVVEDISPPSVSPSVAKSPLQPVPQLSSPLNLATGDIPPIISETCLQSSQFVPSSVNQETDPLCISDHETMQAQLVPDHCESEADIQSLPMELSPENSTSSPVDQAKDVPLHRSPVQRLDSLCEGNTSESSSGGEKHNLEGDCVLDLNKRPHSPDSGTEDDACSSRPIKKPKIEDNTLNYVEKAVQNAVAQIVQLEEDDVPDLEPHSRDISEPSSFCLEPTLSQGSASLTTHIESQVADEGLSKDGLVKTVPLHLVSGCVPRELSPIPCEDTTRFDDTDSGLLDKSPSVLAGIFPSQVLQKTQIFCRDDSGDVEEVTVTVQEQIDATIETMVSVDKETNQVIAVFSNECGEMMTLSVTRDTSDCLDILNDTVQEISGSQATTVCVSESPERSNAEEDLCSLASTVEVTHSSQDKNLNSSPDIPITSSPITSSHSSDVYSRAGIVRCSSSDVVRSSQTETSSSELCSSCGSLSMYGTSCGTCARLKEQNSCNDTDETHSSEGSTAKSTPSCVTTVTETSISDYLSHVSAPRPAAPEIQPDSQSTLPRSTSDSGNTTSSSIPSSEDPSHTSGKVGPQEATAITLRPHANNFSMDLSTEADSGKQACSVIRSSAVSPAEDTGTQVEENGSEKSVLKIEMPEEVTTGPQVLPSSQGSRELRLDNAEDKGMGLSYTSTSTFHSTGKVVSRKSQGKVSQGKVHPGKQPRVPVRCSPRTAMRMETGPMKTPVSAMLQQAKQGRKPCSNADLGCLLVLPPAQLSSHELICDFIQLQCPAHACAWKGLVRKLCTHVREAHRSEIMSGNESSHTVSLHQVHSMRHLTFLREVSRKLFVIGVHSHGPTIFATIQYIASARAERPVTASGTLELLGQDGKLYSWRGHVCAIQQDVELLRSWGNCLEVKPELLGATPGSSITVHANIRVMLNSSSNSPLPEEQMDE